jgi:hypothetical protein
MRSSHPRSPIDHRSDSSKSQILVNSGASYCLNFFLCYIPNLPEHTCLMTKEGKKKVKSNASSTPKYITSDGDTLSSDDDIPRDDNMSSDDDSLPNELFRN